MNIDALAAVELPENNTSEAKAGNGNAAILELPALERSPNPTEPPSVVIWELPAGVLLREQRTQRLDPVNVPVAGRKKGVKRRSEGRRPKSAILRTL
jgi:hypothetical protein